MNVLLLQVHLGFLLALGAFILFSLAGLIAMHRGGRVREGVGFFLACGVFGLGLWLLYLSAAQAAAIRAGSTAPVPPWTGPLPSGLGFWATLLFLQLVVLLGLRAAYPDADPLLLPLVFLIGDLGVLFLCRLSPSVLSGSADTLGTGFGARQLAFLTVGLLVLFISALLVRSRVWLWLRQRPLAPGAVCWLLVLVALIVGELRNGRRLWIPLGPVNLQPSEFLRPACAFGFCALLARSAALLQLPAGKMPVGRALHALAFPFLFLGISCALLVLQGDWGPAVLLVASALLVLYVAARPVALTLGAVGLVAACAAAYLSTHQPAYIVSRFHEWYEPFQHNGHLASALWSISAGSLFGAGLGFGLPQIVPVVYSDFLFAGIAEEFGLAGAGGVLLLYLCLVLCILRIARRCTDPFDKLLSLHVGLLLALQVGWMVGGVSGLVPVSGLTLPIMSYGGSSMVSVLATVGVLYALSDGRERRE